MPNSEFTDLELAVILYYSALGVGQELVSELFRHKLGHKRSLNSLWIAISELKDTGRLWSSATRRWRIEVFGQHLATKMRDRRLRYNFEDLVQWGDQETRVLMIVYVGSTSFNDRHILLITNTVK